MHSLDHATLARTLADDRVRAGEHARSIRVERREPPPRARVFVRRRSVPAGA
jgi:hypothetical protein